MQKAIIYLDSPLGLLEICGEEEWITAVNFVESAKEEVHPSPVTRQCALQLEEYFSGKRKVFDVSLRPEGSEFQQRVWK
jgi:methylated-DNA-[protein]-cysteine S-methyltransferase